MLNNFLIKYGCKPIDIPGPDLQCFLKLLITLYADDTVLFATSKENLQICLNDKTILPTILFGCEIWGFSRHMNTLEKLHLKFCKMVLKLKESTPNIMVYGETGRFDLKYYAKKRIINFWETIACGDKNKLSYITYNLCKQRYAAEPKS